MITVLGVDGHIEDVLEKGSAVGLGDLSPLAVFIKRDRTREVSTLESWLFAAGAEIEFAACGGEAVDVIVGGGTLGCMALGGSAVGREPDKTRPRVANPKGAIAIYVDIVGSHTIFGKYIDCAFGVKLGVIKLNAVETIDKYESVAEYQGFEKAFAQSVPAVIADLDVDCETVGVFVTGSSDEVVVVHFEHTDRLTYGGGDGVALPGLIDVQPGPLLVPAKMRLSLKAIS